MGLLLESALFLCRDQCGASEDSFSGPLSSARMVSGCSWCDLDYYSVTLLLGDSTLDLLSLQMVETLLMAQDVVGPESQI